MRNLNSGVLTFAWSTPTIDWLVADCRAIARSLASIRQLNTQSLTVPHQQALRRHRECCAKNEAAFSDPSEPSLASFNNHARGVRKSCMLGKSPRRFRPVCERAEQRCLLSQSVPTPFLGTWTGSFSNATPWYGSSSETYSGKVSLTISAVTGSGPIYDVSAGSSASISIAGENVTFTTPLSIAPEWQFEITSRLKVEILNYRNCRPNLNTTS